MKRTILFFITVCLCFSSFVSGHTQTRRKQTGPQQKTSHPQNTDQTNKLPNTQTTKARSTSPDAVAQAMVKAVRDNHLAGGSTGLFDAIGLEGDEKTALGSAPGEALNTALATTGEYLANQQKFQGLAMFAGFLGAIKSETRLS